MVQLTVTGPYTAKDQQKADLANKFIGRGSDRSSTAQYAKDYGPYANCGVYKRGDVVFISAEGNRSGRLTPDYKEITLAIKAKVVFVTDNLSDRERSYNIGEREVAEFLLQNNYYEYWLGAMPGRWRPK